jgi:phosphoglycerate-specific signal transduction histidine kinase
MIDTTQILLIAVVTVLTALLTIIGVQVFFILKEIKKTIEKFNKMMDDMGLISESVARPIASLSNSITGVSGIAGLFGWLAKMKDKSKKETKELEEK